MTVAAPPGLAPVASRNSASESVNVRLHASGSSGSANFSWLRSRLRADMDLGATASGRGWIAGYTEVLPPRSTESKTVDRDRGALQAYSREHVRPADIGSGQDCLSCRSQTSVQMQLKSWVPGRNGRDLGRSQPSPGYLVR